MVSFDYSPDRPENIEAILNGLDRYNPEVTSTFQEYVAQQCENQTYDCYGNLALLKLYVADSVTFSRFTLEEEEEEEVRAFVMIKYI
jgi:hypothetical protein